MIDWNEVNQTDGICDECGETIVAGECKRIDGERLCLDCAEARGTQPAEFERRLQCILEHVDEDEDDTIGGCRVTTFTDAGLLTRDRGLVVTLADGSEFQLTIVRSN